MYLETFETQVSGRLGMSGDRSPRHAQNPLSGERRKTLSTTHHARSPPPSHHHLYIIHLINWPQSFYRIRMTLKRPFAPKSDVKQWCILLLLLPRTEDVGLPAKSRFNVVPASKPIAVSMSVNRLQHKSGTTLIHHWVCCILRANTWHSPKAVSMLTHSLRRWPDIETAVGDCIVFTD